MWGVFRRVFSKWQYIVLFLVAALALLSVAILLPNLDLILQVSSTEGVSVFDRLGFVLSLYLALGSNFTWFSVTLTLLLSVLFGLNIALMVHYIRYRQVLFSDKRVKIVGIGGLVSALLGIGCAACGSVLLAGGLAVVGASGLLLALPFHGAEFGVFGVLLMDITTWYIVKRIRDPLVCSFE